MSTNAPVSCALTTTGKVLVSAALVFVVVILGWLSFNFFCYQLDGVSPVLIGVVVALVSCGVVWLGVYRITTCNRKK